MVTGIVLALLALLLGCAPRTPQESEGPVLAIPILTWDFGTLERGESKTRAFPLTNRGRDTLRVTFYSTCDCLTAVPSKAVLPPGGKSRLKLTYMGDEIKAPVTKTVFIDSNDPENPRLTFRVTGNVTPGKSPHLAALPDPLALDPSAPSYPQAHLRIANRGQETLRIEDLTCFGCVNAWSRRELAAGQEVLLEVTPLPDWADRRWLEIESNDPVQPLKRIPIVEFE